MSVVNPCGSLDPPLRIAGHIPTTPAEVLPYTELYPLEVVTNIKTLTPLPPALELEEDNHIYICQLVSRKLGKNKN